MPSILKKILHLNNTVLIVIGLAVGVLLAWLCPEVAKSTELLGNLFVSALKAVAPLLVFVLVAAAIANHKHGQPSHIRPVIMLYLVGTFSAALIAVTASFVFPITLSLVTGKTLSHPGGITEVLSTLLTNVVDNPVHALMVGNFIGILSWSIALGFIFKTASPSSKQLLNDFSDAITKIVQWIIRFAPLGIFGLVSSTLANKGFSALEQYGQLILLLIGCMLFVALVVNPIIVFFKIRRNPYPLVFTCLKDSGITAFFTRSSAANIPVNLQLCERLGLHKETYSVSIPLGATINMSGAAITISILTLAAVHTLNIPVDFLTAFLLSLLAAISAGGSSGVAGGSLLLIPLAASLFGIPNDVAMQVVAVGFVIGVVQDSAETALNSSTDALFTATACIAAERQQHK